MNNALMLSALLTVFAGAAGLEVANAFVWHDRRRLCKALAVMVPLMVAASGAWWFANRYPALNFWGAQGFGPGWECQNLGRGAAQVCLRDLDPRFASEPAGPKGQTAR